MTTEWRAERSEAQMTLKISTRLPAVLPIGSQAGIDADSGFAGNADWHGSKPIAPGTKVSFSTKHLAPAPIIARFLSYKQIAHAELII